MNFDQHEQAVNQSQGLPASGSGSVMEVYGAPTEVDQVPAPPPARPDIPSWKVGAMWGMFGPQAAQRWKQQQMAPYRSEMTSYIVRELMEGRPKTKPISGAEWVGLLHSMDRKLLDNAKLTGGVRFVVDQWNKQALALGQAEAKRAGNMWQSGNTLGLVATPEQRQFMARHGYMLRDFGAPLASSPGVMVRANQAAIGSRPRHSIKSTAFPGLFPNKGMLTAEKIRYETPAKAAQEAAVTTARRKAQQALPAPAWMTYTDPTGRQQKRWSGNATQMDLGQPAKATASGAFKPSDWASAVRGIEKFFMPPGPLGEVARLDEKWQARYFQALRRFLDLREAGADPQQAYFGAVNPKYRPQQMNSPQPAPAHNPQVAARIKQLMGQGKTPAWIRAKLAEVGIDPAPYPELNQ